MTNFASFYGQTQTPAQRDYQLDPRRSLALALLEKSLVQQPISTHAEGIAKLGQAGLGGFMQGMAHGEYKNREQGAADTMAKALQPTQEATGPDGEFVSRPPTAASMAKIASTNPDTLQMAHALTMQDIASQQALAAEGRKLSNAKELKAAPGAPDADGAHVSAPVKNYTYRNQLVKTHGEGSPEVKTFDNYVRAMQTANLGGSVAVIDPANPGKPAAELPKTLPPEQKPETKAAQATAVKTAEGQAQAALDYPKLEGETNYSLQLIDKIVNHPGLPGVVGMPNISGALRLPGTKETDFRTLLDQMQGRQFLQAYETLKGGGVITEVEGTKATQALARMSAAQTEDEFRKGAEEFKSVLVAGLKRAQAKAAGGVSAGPAAPSGVPQPGTVQDGYRFKGGNPADQNSWEKI